MATQQYMRLLGTATVEPSKNSYLPRQMLMPLTMYVKVENLNSFGCCDAVIVHNTCTTYGDNETLLIFWVKG